MRQVVEQRAATLLADGEVVHLQGELEELLVVATGGGDQVGAEGGVGGNRDRGDEVAVVVVVVLGG